MKTITNPCINCKVCKHQRKANLEAANNIIDIIDDLEIKKAVKEVTAYYLTH